MEWWKLGLEYVKVIFTWPIIIAVLILILKKPLIELLLKRDVEVEAAGARLRLGDAKDDLEEALEEAVQISEETITKADPANNDSEGGMVELEEKSIMEDVRRQAMERVLLEGSRLGWEWARSGQDEPPSIVVHWDNEGTPRVLALPKSVVPNRGGRASDSGEVYYRLLLGNLYAAYPGLRVSEHAYDSTGADATINIGGFSADLIIKHRVAGKISTSNVMRIYGERKGRLLPALLITNCGITDAAHEALKKLDSSGRTLVYVVQWIDSSHNENLRKVIELMIADNFSPPSENSNS